MLATLQLLYSIYAIAFWSKCPIATHVPLLGKGQHTKPAMCRYKKGCTSCSRQGVLSRLDIPHVLKSHVLKSLCTYAIANMLMLKLQVTPINHARAPNQLESILTTALMTCGDT